MDSKTLNIYPEKCTGCGDCEAACSIRHAEQGYPGRICIRIMNENMDDDFYLPTTCQQCENPPCLSACPREAIYKDEKYNRVMIARDRCVGCGICVSACPFGAMAFDNIRGRSYKCDLCDGEPECAAACKAGALEYSGPDMLPYPQMMSSAARLTGITRHMADLRRRSHVVLQGQ